jgi:phenylpropionate dioxygenase-like ring-hydroxylating dioxygenase large terminal subunit
VIGERRTTERLIDLRRGQISRRIFSDAAIYQQEMERIFTRCWLFLAHDAMIPEPGDFLTTHAGEDPLIVCRGADGQVRAFLNTCRHRGNKVCLFPRGNAKTFTCAYHGWSYGTDGQLSGVPFHGEAYYGLLDRERLGLVTMPRVERFGGFWFGCWDAEAVPLADDLGGMGWYLDKLLLPLEEMGGLEIVESNFLANGNWKIAAENFAGDHYHTPTTHGSSFKLGLSGNYTQLEPAQM